ncbi:hydroxysqualene dehydroxylase HpnE [Tuwongella immobilis]|uniref:Amine oxidase domain-containing protein n=1 Tax=Tuwongella immobilis TaxID=692036 RepID=A0A6C2YR74_9BACT|nr:hydroxysqualene dehydroxylase HpnE [Tuwongella immobilis]VIP03857.1 squalene-associated fad-dependent desaturase : Squalene-associated FAD-dependent desaturase OS=Singulisphaera acidiphila (strain ATCC BAA-1392 / DSM 18658 / VKM B-2454 / MOB10) GN=Sinac_5222 PE=4 SV=1: Amino_oxidase [Tuwongella immobilis]VTS05081.1 squalene-associated fad-dependent desaturase : Squalene-associated FAD-dependent desaturase OS=Singulisphaera acidiphila (strain ATCC BAA-1392 / DSM 18658 / VKM B-2454 / MOB10) GN=S
MTSPVATRESIVIVGGGLAGLAAAIALAPRGHRITLLESRNRLGGRASSFHDATTGQLLDACQHVSMGCCTNLAHFSQTIGVDRFLQPQPVLWFMTPDRRISRFAADPVPAPFHLSRALLAAHYLTFTDKLRLVRGMLALMRLSADADEPLLPWLKRHGQNDRTITRFWGLVLTSALNETVERVGTKYARKVFLDGFLRHRKAFEVQVPTVPLGRLYGEELQGWLSQHGVTVRLGQGVRQVEFADGRAIGVQFRTGETLPADRVILAVPFDRVVEMIPEAMRSQLPSMARVPELTPSPITSVHLWYDRAVMDYPHLVLIDCLGQWIFDRGEDAAGGHYVQVVVSASRELRNQGHAEVERAITAEIQRLLPKASDAKVLRSRVITEMTATFSAVPGVDALRAPQVTAIPSLVLAGDWTLTGWPATMEGAVRSGYRAAEVICAARGESAQFEQPDLR